MLTPIVAAAGGPLPGNLGLSLATVPDCPGLFTIDLRGTPLVVCGLAEEVEDVKPVWAALVDLADGCGVLVPEVPPRFRPWLSVLILPSIVTASRDIVELLGDLERCIAWTILET